MEKLAIRQQRKSTHQYSKLDFKPSKRNRIIPILSTGVIIRTVRQSRTACPVLHVVACFGHQEHPHVKAFAHGRHFDALFLREGKSKEFKRQNCGEIKNNNDKRMRLSVRVERHKLVVGG